MNAFYLQKNKISGSLKINEYKYLYYTIVTDSKQTFIFDFRGYGSPKL